MVAFNFKRDDTVRFNFGKYRGRAVSDVGEENEQYLSWCCLNMAYIQPAVLKAIYDTLTELNDDDFVEAIKDEREQLFGLGGKKKKKFNFDNFDEYADITADAVKGSTSGISRAAVERLALDVFRDMAKRWHPDLCKGSSEPMKAVNQFYDKLKELIMKL